MKKFILAIIVLFVMASCSEVTDGYYKDKIMKEVSRYNKTVTIQNYNGDVLKTYNEVDVWYYGDVRLTIVTKYGEKITNIGGIVTIYE